MPVFCPSRDLPGVPPGAWVALSLGLALSSAGLPAHAGAWTQPAGGYYVKIAFAGLDSRTRFDGSGDRVAYRTFGAIARDAEYRNREIRGYAEYGAFERLTAYGALAYKRLAVEERTAIHETSGLGDLDLGARWRLTTGAIPVSLAVELRVPTGYSNGDNPALGAGQTDAAVKALAGVSGVGWYATGDLGWMERGGGFRSQVLGSLEAGGRVARRLGGRTVLRWARSAGGTTSRVADGFDPAIASPRTLTLDGAVSVDVAAGMALEVGLSGVIAGRDALAGNMIEVAIVRSAGRAR